MSYKDGISAINLQMPPRVPRTEYSAESHWDLVKTVTGIDVGPESSKEAKTRATSAFIKAWNYDFFWTTLTFREELTGRRTSMGHAEYSSGGTDFSSEISCPFKDVEEVLSFDPWQEYGSRDTNQLVRKYEQHYDNQVSLFPDNVNMTGIYITLISGLIEIFGWEMLLTAAGADQRRFGEVANRHSSWIMQYFEALAQSNVPVVMIHDDIVWASGAFISPDWYRKYVFPNYKKMFAPLVDSGKKVMYTSDGNYTAFIDDIAQCGVSGFVMEPTTDMKYIAEKYGRTHSFVGNADTRILLSGSKKQIRAEVKRCMDIGKKCPGFFMAVGNHIPANTPVENALYYNQCYEEMSKR